MVFEIEAVGGTYDNVYFTDLRWLLRRVQPKKEGTFILHPVVKNKWGKAKVDIVVKLGVDGTAMQSRLPGGMHECPDEVVQAIQKTQKQARALLALKGFKEVTRVAAGD